MTAREAPNANALMCKRVHGYGPFLRAVAGEAPNANALMCKRVHGYGPFLRAVAGCVGSGLCQSR
jgi:hypothetical protein